MKKIFYFLLFLTLIIVVTYTVTSPFISLYIKKTVPLLDIDENQITLIGVLRTSGVSDHMAAGWSISKPTYQITSLTTKFSYSNIEFDGAYLVNSDVPLEKYLGRCVQLKAGVQELSKSFINGDYLVNGEYTYKNLLLYPIKVQPLLFLFCKPYNNKLSSEDIEKDPQRLLVTGTMGRLTRDTPDIGYDYEIILDIPYIDPLSSAGPSKQKNSILVVPATNSIWEKIERNIGKRVTLDGHMSWGYAESRFLLVRTLEEI